MWVNAALQKIAVQLFQETKNRNLHKRSIYAGSYHLNGAVNQIRTGDLFLTKEVLCLLSYSSILRPRWGSRLLRRRYARPCSLPLSAENMPPAYFLNAETLPGSRPMGDSLFLGSVENRAGLVFGDRDGARTHDL